MSDKNKILIVDDELEIIDLITATLKPKFPDVVGVQTVDEALEILSVDKFCCVIVDISVGDRNGGEVVQYINNEEDSENFLTPVVVCSGFVTDEFKGRLKGLFAAILSKPFDGQELLQAVAYSAYGQDADLDKIGPITVCRTDLPFPMTELKGRVTKTLNKVKSNKKLKILFQQMKVDRKKDNYLMAHIGLIINISGGICKGMDWNSEKTLQKFLYAAYIHDQGVSDRPDLARKENTEGLNEEDKKLVMEHPEFACSNLDKVDQIPDDVQTIIRQHHERPDKSGFPEAIGKDRISALSAIFIIAHDLADYILLNPKWKCPPYLVSARKKFKGNHFNKALNALEKVMK